MFLLRSTSKRSLALVLALAMLLSLSGAVDKTAEARAKSVKKITLSNPKSKTLALKKGKAFQLKVKISPKGMSKKIAYKSSNKSIVSVNNKGKLKAKKAGKAMITVFSKTKPSKKVRLTVTVYKKQKKADQDKNVPPKKTAPPQPTTDPLLTTQKEGSFTVAAKDSAVDIYIDAQGEDYDGLSLVAHSVAGDIALVSKDKARAKVVSSTDQMKEYAISRKKWEFLHGFTGETPLQLKWILLCWMRKAWKPCQRNHR